MTNKFKDVCIKKGGARLIRTEKFYRAKHRKHKMQQLLVSRNFAIVISAMIFASIDLKAQTVDLVCSGQVTQEYVLIGKAKQRDPLVYQKNVNYHFLNGTPMVQDKYPIVKIPYPLSCTWSKGQVSCRALDLTGHCAEAEEQGVIEKQFSYCRNSLKINRFTGALSEESWSYQKNHALFGEIIFGETYKAQCEVATQQKF